MVITQMPYRPVCPDCEGTLFVEQLITYTMPYTPYGQEHPVNLTVQHLADVCLNPMCKAILVDWRGEDARVQAVHDYELLLSTDNDGFPQATPIDPAP